MIIQFPYVINGQWRIVDDPVQWILQNRGVESKHWCNRSFCRSKAGLRQCLKEYIGVKLDEEWPEWHE